MTPSTPPATFRAETERMLDELASRVVSRWPHLHRMAMEDRVLDAALAVEGGDAVGMYARVCLAMMTVGAVTRALEARATL